MTAVDLPAIRALLAGIEGAHMDVYPDYYAHIKVFVTANHKDALAAFIAAAPPIVTQLLGVMEAQQAKLDAVTKIIEEKYHLWAAICGETCVKDVLGIDHDAIADAIANRIRAAIDGEDAA